MNMFFLPIQELKKQSKELLFTNNIDYESKLNNILSKFNGTSKLREKRTNPVISFEQPTKKSRNNNINEDDNLIY